MLFAVTAKTRQQTYTDDYPCDIRTETKSRKLIISWQPVCLYQVCRGRIKLYPVQSYKKDVAEYVKINNSNYKI